MAPAPKSKSNSKSNSDSQLTRADAEAWLRQFPFRGWFALGLQALMVLASNGFVWWLLQTGRLPGAGLILLVVLEVVLLFALVRLLAVPVPIRDWFEPPRPWRETLPVLAFLVFWCAGAYGLTLVVISGWPDFLAYFRGGAPWVDTGVLYALAITAVLAVVGGVGDYLRYRRIGPPYMSSVATELMARMLTLIFGAIPFAMPFFVVTLGGFKGVEWIVGRARGAPGAALAGAAAMIAVGLGGFALIDWLIAGGTSGWAIGYVLAKTVSELLVVAIPLVMREVARGG
jgi:hypothetical protein